MARKPNYAFERLERERAKALKQAEKAEAKLRQREQAAADDAAPKADGAAPATDEA